jgi:tetratricopeptide (TPR) repeat protein
MFEALSDRTEQALAIADSLAESGDLEGAVAALSTALVREDDREGRMVLLWQRAHVRRRQLRAVEAIDDLTALIALSPELSAPYLERGQLYMVSDSEAAARDFTAAHERRPEPSTLLLRAAARRDADDLEGAIADYDAVLLAGDPRLVEEARDGRALARQLRNMLARALPFESTDLETLLDRGDAAMGDDPATALRIHQRAAALAPTDPRATLGLRLSRSRLTQTAQAEIAVMKTRERPDLLAPLLSRADSLRRNGRVDDAVEVLHEARDRHPESGEVYYEIGLTLSCWQREPERAIAFFDRALEVAPGHLQALRHRALAFKELDDHARAIADFDRIVERAPADRTVYMNRGLCHLARGDHASAVSDFTAHVRVDGASEYILSRRAEARLGLGDLPGALADLTAAIADMEASSWKTAGPYAARAELHQRLGDLPAARADLERALDLERDRGFDRAVDVLEARLADLP